jgi:hypothetical protein
MDDALALQKCTRLLRDLYLRVTQIILQARLDFDPSLCDATELRAVYGSLGSFNFRDRVELQCLRCLQRLSSMLGGGEQLLGGDAMNGFSIAIYKVPRAAQTVDGREPEASRELLERWSIQLLDPSERTTDDRGGGSSLSASSMHRKGDFASLYKKAIIFVRSLYSYTRMVPAHGLARYAKRKPAPRRPGGGGGAAAPRSRPPIPHAASLSHGHPAWHGRRLALLLLGAALSGPMCPLRTLSCPRRLSSGGGCGRPASPRRWRVATNCTPRSSSPHR